MGLRASMNKPLFADGDKLGWKKPPFIDVWLNRDLWPRLVAVPLFVICLPVCLAMACLAGDRNRLDSTGQKT